MPPECCAPLPVAAPAGAWFAVRLLDSFVASCCAPELSQSGFVMLAIITISTAMHAAAIASPLINISTEYCLRRSCGTGSASGSYRRRRISFSKPLPEGGNPDVSPHSLCPCARDGDIGGAVVRNDEAAEMRDCSWNLFGIICCFEVSSSSIGALMLESPFWHRWAQSYQRAFC